MVVIHKTRNESTCPRRDSVKCRKSRAISKSTAAAVRQSENRRQEKTGKHSRNAPAKGIHAKTGNSQADKKLAQRRVGVFIGAESVKILVGGSGKDGFIKYGSG